MCLTAAVNLNAKYCRQYMPECRRKTEATRPTRYHIAFWNKIGTDSRSKALTDSYTKPCRKPIPISFQLLGHPNANQLIIHYQSIPCLYTLVGSLRYLNNLLKYRLFY